MGLEGLENTAKRIMENSEGPLELTALRPFDHNFMGNWTGVDNTANLLVGLADLNLEAKPMDCLDQMQLLMQAHSLLRKSELYQKIEETLQMSYVFQPNVFNNLPRAVEQHFKDENTVTCLHRDAAVNNLRLLNIFYGYTSGTFSLAVNLLDRLLGKVKAQPRYLSCITTTCFYIAARTMEYGKSNVFIPTATELVKLSQCGGNEADLGRMEMLILDKLQWELEAVTPLSFLKLFYEVYAGTGQCDVQPSLLNSLIAKLEVLLCQFDFTKYRAETLALALLSCCLQDQNLLNCPEQLAPILELQYYCQVSDCEFMQCRGLITDYLAVYGNQPTKMPRLQLVWSVSKRTLNKLRPSTRCILDLEPIMEDETDSEGEDDDDSGPFDSENDESDLMRASGILVQQSARRLFLPPPPAKMIKVSNDKDSQLMAVQVPLYADCTHCPGKPPKTMLDHNHNATPSHGSFASPGEPCQEKAFLEHSNDQVCGDRRCDDPGTPAQRSDLVGGANQPQM